MHSMIPMSHLNDTTDTFVLADALYDPNVSP